MVSPYERYSSGLATRFGRGFLFPLLKILLIAFLLYLFISRLFITSFKVDSGSLQRGGVARAHTGSLTPRYMIKRVIAVPGDTVRMSQYVAYIKTAGSAD